MGITKNKLVALHVCDTTPLRYEKKRNFDDREITLQANALTFSFSSCGSSLILRCLNRNYIFVKIDIQHCFEESTTEMYFFTTLSLLINARSNRIYVAFPNKLILSHETKHIRIIVQFILPTCKKNIDLKKGLPHLLSLESNAKQVTPLLP